MSLEELRAQVEAEETQATEQPEVQETEQEEQPESEAEESEKAEESTDFELELEGEPEPTQQKLTTEEILQFKLSRKAKQAAKAKQEATDAKSEVESLRQEIATLKKIISKPEPVTSAAEPVMPDLYDPGIEGDRKKYDAAVKKFLTDMQSYNNRHNEADKVQADYKQRIDGMTKNLAVRAAKFATEHKVNVDRVASALETATGDIDASTGIDGSMAYLLDSVGDGSERVAYYIGTNETARAQIKAMLKEDPNGLKAIAHMTRLAEKLKPKPSKSISKAPEPDQPLRGDSVATATAAKLQAMYDKESDFSKLRAIRKRAEELGYKLKA